MYNVQDKILDFMEIVQKGYDGDGLFNEQNKTGNMAMASQ